MPRGRSSTIRHFPATLHLSHPTLHPRRHPVIMLLVNHSTNRSGQPGFRPPQTIYWVSLSSRNGRLRSTNISSSKASLTLSPLVMLVRSPIWCAIIADHFWSGQPRLGCSGRPEAVREWLKYGRKYNIPPALGNIDSFIKSWWTWWQMLQPEWRKSGNGSATEMTRVAPPGDPDWSNTAKTGTNGLLIVMMTLSWWMGAVTGTDCWGAFCVALDDVSFVLDQIISAYPVRQASAQ